MNINIPIAGLRDNSKIGKLIYFVFNALSLLYISQAYRIIFKSSDALMLVRVTEDFVLIGLLISTIILQGNLKVKNLIPFILLFVYLSFNYLIVLSDFDQLRRFTITMFWFTVAINLIGHLKINHFFYTVCFLGILSSSVMVFNIEQTIAMYILENQRIHAEGEGLGININNITLILVALTATATVLKKNAPYIKYGTLLILILYTSVAIVLLIGATRSAFLFYMLLLFYYLFSINARLIIVPLIFSVFLFFISFIFIDNLVVVSRIVDFDPQSSSRILAMIDSMSNFANYPMFGIGEIYQENIQIRNIGEPDHNFYSRFLGSNGLVGFIFVILFLNGMGKFFIKGLKGAFILKGFLFYTFFFAPAGPGFLVVATASYYLSILKHKDESKSFI